MWIWSCEAVDWKNDKIVKQDFNDSDILLDCIIESEAEGFHYCLDRCLNWCKKMITFSINFL